MTIPVTILGGFLGAGKTTALNGLLRRPTPAGLCIGDGVGGADHDGGAGGRAEQTGSSHTTKAHRYSFGSGVVREGGDLVDNFGGKAGD